MSSKAYCWAVVASVVYSTLMPALHAFTSPTDSGDSGGVNFMKGMPWPVLLGIGALRLLQIAIGVRTNNFVPNCHFFHWEVVAGVLPNNDENHVRKPNDSEIRDMFGSMWRYGCACCGLPFMLYWYLWVEFAMILAWTDAFPESEDGVWLPFTLSNALVYVAMLVGIQNYVKALIYMVYACSCFPCIPCYGRVGGAAKAVAGSRDSRTAAI